MTEKDEGDETTAGDVNINSCIEMTYKTGEANNDTMDPDISEGNNSKNVTKTNRKRDSLPLPSYDGGELNTSDQRLRLNVPTAERSKSECLRTTDRTNFFELQKLEEAMCRADDMEAPFPPPKRSVFQRLLRTRSNVVHTSASEGLNHNSNLKRTGSTRVG